MAYEYTPYNGNANEYINKLQERRQQRLAKKYWDSVKKTEAGQEATNGFRDDAMNSAKSSLDKQQEFDRSVVEASDLWDQEFQEQDQQVDAHFQELEALLEGLHNPTYYDVSGYGGGSSNYADEQIEVDDSKQNIEAQRRSLEDLLGA